MNTEIVNDTEKEPEYITLKQFAKDLNTPEYHLRRAAKAGEFPCRKLGRAYVALREDMRTWVSSGRLTARPKKKSEKGVSVKAVPAQ